MNEFHAMLLDIAWKRCWQDAIPAPKTRLKEIPLLTLSREMERIWCEFRDGTVEYRAQTILTHCPATHLWNIFDAVADLVLGDWELYDWEPPNPEEDPREIVLDWVAHALAALRWCNRTRQGRSLEPNWKRIEPEIETYRQKHLPRQLTLF